MSALSRWPPFVAHIEFASLFFISRLIRQRRLVLGQGIVPFGVKRDYYSILQRKGLSLAYGTLYNCRQGLRGILSALFYFG